MLRIIRGNYRFSCSFQVAWQGLIDALIQPGVEGSLTNSTRGHEVRVLRTSEFNNSQSEAERHSKRIKVIMEPIRGIMSSKCDVSVRASCLSLWSYLLHKLEDSVSSESVIKNVWEPVIEAVFQIGPDDKNIWSWNFCLDLFDILISGRNQVTTGNLFNQEPHQISPNNAIRGHLATGKCSLRHYPINCCPWNRFQLDFFIKMISIILNQESNATVTSEYRELASSAALRLFGSLVETVQRALRCDSITYSDVVHCLDTIFKFLGKICENVTSEDDSNYYCPHTCLIILMVVTEKLEPSILESPLYKVSLENRFIQNLECANEIRSVTVPGICFIEFEEMVLPVVYLINLYFSVVVRSSLKSQGYGSLLLQMQGYLKFLLSSYNPQEVLHAFTCLLYTNAAFNSLQIWVVLVNCLKEYIDGKTDQGIQQMVKDKIGYSIILHLLSYPLASWSFSTRFELQSTVDVWNLLYASVAEASQSVHCPAKSFSEDFSAILNGCIDQYTLAVDTGAELQLKEEKSSGGFVLLSGNIIICLLKHLIWSTSSEGRHYIDSDGRGSNVLNSMVLAAR